MNERKSGLIELKYASSIFRAEEYAKKMRMEFLKKWYGESNFNEMLDYVESMAFKTYLKGSRDEEEKSRDYY